MPGIGAKEAAANLGLSVQEAHDLIMSVCAGVTTNTPRCEQGHEEAAQRALERGDLDQYMFHLGALFNCFLGEPAGPPFSREAGGYPRRMASAELSRRAAVPRTTVRRTRLG